jgi:flagellar hook-associated protein 2
MATSSVSSTASTTTAADIQAANKAAAQRLLSSLGAGSGVDVAALAQNLVDAERIPKENAINAKITKNESKISGLSAVMFMMNELKTNLGGLKDKNSYNTLGVANSAPTALNVTANTAATAGTYALNINSLAQPQRSMSAGFASKTTLINGGTLFDMVLSSSRAGVSSGTTANTAPSRATITAPSFGTTPATTDFSQFDITVGGTSYSLTPAPASASLSALATDLQTQLRALDSTMSVSVVDGNLVATSSDYTKRISQMSLTLDSGTTGGSVGTSDISPVATYTSSLSGVSFGTNPSVTDFKQFSVTVDGKAFNMTPAPKTADLTALAEDLTSQLQALDGTDELSVTLTGTNTLVVRSSSTARKVYDPTLSTSTTIKLDTGADAGTPSATGNAITDIAFGTIPSTNNFKSFSVKIGDNLRTIIPAPTAPTVASLAEDLQKRLRILEGSDDVVVTANGNDISISSTSGKAIKQAVLSKQTYTDTPEGVVAAINEANRGVTAELINDGSSGTPYKIMVKGESGASESFSLASSTSGLLSLTTSSDNTATDATLSVNGISYARKTNSFSDVITGVTLDLRATTTTQATIVLSQDSSAIKEKLKALVTAYNDFDSIISETTNPKSDLATYGKTLVGDSTVKMVRQQMRNLLLGQSTTPGTAITSLGDLGFKTDSKGVLSLDETTLDKALKDNYGDVIKAMTGNQNNLNDRFTQPAGIAADAYRRLTSLVAPTGILMSKSGNATTENEKYSADLEKIKARMETLLARYTKQFSLMESMVGGVNAQKTSLKSTFDGMMSMYTNK